MYTMKLKVGTLEGSFLFLEDIKKIKKTQSQVPKQEKQGGNRGC